MTDNDARADALFARWGDVFKRLAETGNPTPEQAAAEWEQAARSLRDVTVAQHATILALRAEATRAWRSGMLEAAMVCVAVRVTLETTPNFDGSLADKALREVRSAIKELVDEGPA